MRYTACTLALAILTSLAGAIPALAVGVTVQPVITSLTHLDQSVIDPQAITYQVGNRLAVAPGTAPLQINLDYNLSITGLSGVGSEIGFGNVAFDLNTDNLTTPAEAPGWSPNVATVDTNGDLPEGEAFLWSDNGDYGLSGTDLQSIVVGLAPGEFGEVGVDPRRTVGQLSPALLGSMTFEWTPSAESNSGVSVVVDEFSTYGADGRLRVRPGGVKTGGWLEFFVSEGQSGDTDRDGDVDLNDLNNVRNHFDETGEGIVGDTAPYDGVVDLDDLNRVRSNFGETLGGGAPLAAVPEPSSIGLSICGIAFLAARLRRRFGA
jgi:hypothetical protein